MFEIAISGLCALQLPHVPQRGTSSIRNAIGLLAVTVTTAKRDKMHVLLKYPYMRRVIACHNIPTRCVARKARRDDYS